MTDQIIYEHPLNERIRTFLRLEYLFKKIEHFLPQQEAWGSRAAISGLLDIITILSRAELKTELLKELERHNANLGKIRRQKGVDMQALGEVLDSLERTASELYKLNGQIGKRLRSNEFLGSIAQRSSIPGGTCNFDLPQYHAWLRQPHEVRERDVGGWMADLDPIRNAVALLLSLTRSSSDTTQAMAHHGVYQQVLDPNAPAQLVRIGVDSTSPFFPEISGNKHRFNVRFMEITTAERAMQTHEDAPFSLTCCII
ncbi:MAG TPA: cell division protein ZapD [Chromatiales bacterium]|nr:cell division protein ZapD [Chromatiales bacterium]